MDGWMGNRKKKKRIVRQRRKVNILEINGNQKRKRQKQTSVELIMRNEMKLKHHCSACFHFFFAVRFQESFFGLPQMLWFRLLLYRQWKSHQKGQKLVMGRHTK